MQTHSQANTNAGQILTIRNEQASLSRQATTADDMLSKDKRKRRKMPKVKTGCLTCKVRRVKCDEAKPHCYRCVRHGVTCAGYADPEARPTSPIPKPTGYRRIVPRNTQRNHNLFQIPPTHKIHTGPQFRDEREACCFRTYLEETAVHITGPFKNSLWEQLIPQTSLVEPYIRHAVVAIGALSKVSIDKGSDHKIHHNKSCVCTCYGTSEYAYALRYYGKALQGMRTAIANGVYDFRQALIACILVFCFESLQGKLGSAVTHAESGLMLLHQLESTSMTPQSTSLMSRECQKYGIDRDIMDAFSGLDLHVLFFLDRRPERVHRGLIAIGNNVIQKMPVEFHTVQEARNFWLPIMRRNYHFIILALTASRARELGGLWRDENDTPWEGSANILPGENMFSTCNIPCLELYEEHLKYQEDIKQWSLASMALFERINEAGRQDEKVKIALLKIHQITNHIMLAGAFITMETAYDNFLPQFRTVLSLCQYVHSHLISSSKGSALYQFDLGIVIALFLLGLRCRDPTTRKPAIDLLLSAPYREGAWDSLAAGHLLCWVSSIEDEGRDEFGYVAEHKRVFMTSSYVDLHNRRAVLGCTQRSLDGLVFMERTINW